MTKDTDEENLHRFSSVRGRVRQTKTRDLAWEELDPYAILCHSLNSPVTLK